MLLYLYFSKLNYDRNLNNMFIFDDFRIGQTDMGIILYACQNNSLEPRYHHYYSCERCTLISC